MRNLLEKNKNQNNETEIFLTILEIRAFFVLNK